MAVENLEIDAAKAAAIARNQAISVSGNLATYTFKLSLVEKNTDPDVWKVHCEYLTRPSDADPTKYLIKVNVASGKIVSIKQEV
ncbi:MAG: hypothetical protein WCX64_06420 [Candidatus Micrarchaeia archaeon]